jgi:dTDP-4-amino-4,6-dideoxygalactose transaminase
MFNQVELFEEAIAKYYNAPYAVAVDCCTHAIELCLRYTNVRKTSCPTNTYISVPFTFKKLNIDWKFENNSWIDYYFLGDTNIVDAAVYWKEDGYISNTLMCLSFQFKKHLSLGRGGAILCDNLQAYTELKKLSYDGRSPDQPWAEQNIDTVGYHYYMTPETARLGMAKLYDAIKTQPRNWSHIDYPFLPSMKVFNDQ